MVRLFIVFLPQNWSFLARFCFLSEHGEFEYYIEYNERQGEPNLLLYYDDGDQWPAVYKTYKVSSGSCSLENDLNYTN